MYETLKLKLGLPWRTQYVGVTRVLGYLQRKAVNREYKQLKTKKCAALYIAERSWRFEEHFDIRHGDSGVGACLDGF